MKFEGYRWALTNFRKKLIMLKKRKRKKKSILIAIAKAEKKLIQGLKYSVIMEQLNWEY